MSWLLISTISRAFPVDPIRIPVPVGSLNPNLVVLASFNSGSPSWHFAGWLYPVIEAPEIGLFQGRWKKVWFGMPKAFSFNTFELPFDLEFRSVGYLHDINLFIWQSQNRSLPVDVSSVEFG